MALRYGRVGVAAMTLGVLLATAVTMPAAANSGSTEVVTADLDGVPLKLEQVGKWYCDDFNYPAIHCFSNAVQLESRATLFQLLTAVDFVTVYEAGSYSGSFMHMSQDYTALATIGWNDRISSLRGRNSEQSHFFADWFYGGTTYSVCCNTQISSLGTYDNTFSSVHRN